eukprot:CAMPEP_0202961622 /NCGR_PEP_ID=MMETSP1396-20130829/5695_1 /ASSEMBLY_ACC=CAM_ASM_000872 /TAXON_ID= /ORGANISM="Pseudokeronopsis sp., Strain Brazil" /LENGTH=155 /DNA_ID=CAMNT_0049681597 /DNA_START=1088 /DNA_END=1555 /DNA_ORIENTATION=-
MAFCCEVCGYRNSDIKQGGGISEKATRLVLKVESSEDLNRDLYKSDSCVVAIPEIDFAMAPGSLGSKYTTVEGLIDSIHTRLQESNPFGQGDSSTNSVYLQFLDKLLVLKDPSAINWKPFTLVLDDALSSCFILNPKAPLPDPNLTVTIYERTEE